MKRLTSHCLAWVTLSLWLLQGCSDGSSPCDPAAFAPDIAAGGMTEIMVPMRDCIRLATNVYLPGTSGPHPLVLIRLPYGKDASGDTLDVTSVLATFFLTTGLAVAVQDTRGRFRSDGEWEPLLHEQADGIDTVHWIEAQPWFDGNLATAGASYFGFTQLALAHQQPATLRTIVPMITPSSAYSLFYHNGLVRSDITVGWSLGIREPTAQTRVPGQTVEAAAMHWPLVEADDAFGGDIPWYNEWLDHPFDTEYYDRYLPRDVYDRIDTPILMISGWFDIFNATQLADFERVQAREGGSGASRIIVGPWTHSMGVLESHDLVFEHGGNLLTFQDKLLEWYGHHLKGTPMSAWGPVMLYDPGLDEWIERRTLWPKDRPEHLLYLGGDRGAAACGEKGVLSTTPSVETRALTYVYDPRDPIIREGGALLSAEWAGAKRQKDLCSRTDVLVFESEGRATDLTLDGAISVSLSVASSAPDTAFVARLSLVKPDGQAFYFREGYATLSHREGNRMQTRYKPGERVDLHIDMPPILWTLRQGDRLRLEISSSNLRAVAPHPNVDHDWNRTAEPRAAAQTIFLDRENSSALRLEVRP